MLIFVKAGGPSVPIEVNPHSSVTQLKEAIEELQHIPTERQILSYGVRLCDDECQSLADLGIDDGATVFLTCPLEGGKKKKKKVYTKPKKGKHKKKKVKLAILKCYEIKDNEVVRLRKQCPNGSCGDGVFMALHAQDKARHRSYCGRCTMVYMPQK